MLGSDLVFAVVVCDHMTTVFLFARVPVAFCDLGPKSFRLDSRVLGSLGGVCSRFFIPSSQDGSRSPEFAVRGLHGQEDSTSYSVVRFLGCR